MSTTTTTRTNRYAARCTDCGQNVPAETGTLTKGTSGWEVRHLDACPAPAAPAAPAYTPEQGDVHLIDGTVYRFRRGRESGRIYGLAAVVRDGEVIDWTYTPLARIAGLAEANRMSAAEARAFGLATGVCVRCAADLDDPRSVAVGYGPTCAKHMGWPYPTLAEANVMLAAEA